jgi:putative transposase
VPGRSSPRLKTFTYLGRYGYSLTCCTFQRQRVFTDAATVDGVWSQILHAARAEGFAISAYCFMPDHLHLLCEGTCPSSDFKEFVRLYKQRSSFAWKQRTRLGLWQRGYFDRVLRADEDTVAVARYILENPVRAGLSQSAEEYPYSGSFTMEVNDLLGSIQMDGWT